jgi:hypothetical protein
VRGSFIEFGSRQAWIPIGTPNPGVKIRDLGGQSGRFQANHALFVVHDRFQSPIHYIWLRGWYEQHIVVLVQGCLRGYLKNQNLERVTAGFTKKRIFKKLAGLKLATTVTV